MVRQTANEMQPKTPLSEVELVRRRVRRKKLTARIIYLTAGAIMALLFLLPLIYMISTSTKSETRYVADAGTLSMFLPSFNEPLETLGNYVKVLTGYGVWKYALNTLIYATVVIVLNVIVNGLAGYAMAKFNFPGKGFFSFIILFLIDYSVVRHCKPNVGLDGNEFYFDAGDYIAFVHQHIQRILVYAIF